MEEFFVEKKLYFGLSQKKICSGQICRVNGHLARKQEIKARPEESIRMAIRVNQVSVLKRNTIRV